MKLIRRIYVVLFCVLLSVGMILPVRAAESAVSYVGNGQSEEFLFSVDGKTAIDDLFPEFKGVMPGDSLTQQILIKNGVRNGVKIKVYLRSKGANEADEKFLSQMNLTVNQSGTSKLFDAPANQKAQLHDWVYLGTVYSGGIIQLNVTLDVPITLGNEFQDAKGSVEWEIMVEELPTESTDPKPSMSDKLNSVMHTTGVVPKTGDNAVILLYIILILGSLMFGLYQVRKKCKNSNNRYEQ